MERIIKDLEEFKSFAREFAVTLRGGQVIGLIGDLGAGKTTFVQEIAARFGVAAAPKSPTFVLMQIHPTGPEASQFGIARLCHIDAYRLDDMVALKGIGFEEYAEDPSTLTLIEWADRTPELATHPNYREVRIQIEGDARRVEVR